MAKKNESTFLISFEKVINQNIKIDISLFTFYYFFCVCLQLSDLFYAGWFLVS